MKGKPCFMNSSKRPIENLPHHNKSMTKEELLELLRKLPPKERIELLLEAKQRKEDKLIE